MPDITQISEKQTETVIRKASIYETPPSADLKAYEIVQGHLGKNTHPNSLQLTERTFKQQPSTESFPWIAKESPSIGIRQPFGEVLQTKETSSAEQLLQLLSTKPFEPSTSLTPKEEEEYQAYLQSECTSTSQILGFSVSHYDVLLLFFELLKIGITEKEQEKISRRQERDFQCEHMKNVVENFKTQSSFALMTGVGAGIIGIGGSLLPIIGHMKGQSIIDTFSGWFTSLKDANPKKVFDSLARTARSMEKLQGATSEIHRAYSESGRTYDQHLSDLARTDGEECTRTLDDMKQNDREIINFINQLLQEKQEETRSLYS